MDIEHNTDHDVLVWTTGADNATGRLQQLSTAVVAGLGLGRDQTQTASEALHTAVRRVINDRGLCTSPGPTFFKILDYSTTMATRSVAVCRKGATSENISSIQ